MCEYAFVLSLLRLLVYCPANSGHLLPSDLYVIPINEVVFLSKTRNEKPFKNYFLFLSGNR